jgi:hypothetical protein
MNHSNLTQRNVYDMLENAFTNSTRGVETYEVYSFEPQNIRHQKRVLLRLVIIFAFLSVHKFWLSVAFKPLKREGHFNYI